MHEESPSDSHGRKKLFPIKKEIPCYFYLIWAPRNDNLERISSQMKETQAFPGQWMVCMNQGYCSLGCVGPTLTASRITLARSVASCELSWSGFKRSFHLEELQQRSLVNIILKGQESRGRWRWQQIAKVGRSHMSEEPFNIYNPTRRDLLFLF